MVIQQWMKFSVLFSITNHEENGYKPFSWVFDGLMDWFEGKSTENHSFTQQQSGFPAKFPMIRCPKINVDSMVGNIGNHTNSKNNMDF